MKIKHLIIPLTLTSMLFSCNGQQEKDQQQSLEEISKQELVTALEERDQLLALVKEVSVGLEQIKQLENIMTIAAAHPTENMGQKAQILTDIASLKEKIQQRKAQLQDLENKLQKSTINNKELQETINALRIQIDSQIEEIESLKQQLIAAILTGYSYTENMRHCAQKRHWLYCSCHWHYCEAQDIWNYTDSQESMRCLLYLC